MSRYASGANWERAVLAWERDAGAIWAIRAAGSHGPWDVVAVYPKNVLLIQCKCSPPSLAERQAMWKEAQKIERPRDFLAYCYVRGTKNVPEVFEINAKFAEEKREGNG